MTYDIFEGNMERLTKKLATIKNKCSKLGCSFHFEELGETFKTVKVDGKEKTLRYITVEAEGKAQLADWEFIATIEHNKPTNIIRCFRQDVEIPEKYWTADTYCDHCKTRRYRKDTYIIRNTQTGEFKQVGRSCLKDFTNGLSAEAVASYISWFDEVIKAGEAPSEGYKTYDETIWVLMNALEAVRMYGYVKSTDWGITTRDITMEQVHEFGKYRDRIKDGFDASKHSELAENILSWVSEQQDDHGYITNLKGVCGKSYCERRDFGLICSAVAAYNREMSKREAKQQETKPSEWFGTVGDKVRVVDAKLRLLTSWDSQFGYTYMYKITAEDGTVFTWKTGKWLSNTDELPEKISLKGSIKAHNEFRGVKQTELTRCTRI